MIFKQSKKLPQKVIVHMASRAEEALRQRNKRYLTQNLWKIHFYKQLK